MNSMGLRSTAWPFDRLAAMFAWRLRCISSWLKSNESCKKLKTTTCYLWHSCWNSVFLNLPTIKDNYVTRQAKIWPKGAKFVYSFLDNYLAMKVFGILIWKSQVLDLAVRIKCLLCLKKMVSAKAKYYFLVSPREIAHQDKKKQKECARTRRCLQSSIQFMVLHSGQKCFIQVACLWSKMPMFQREEMREGGKPLPLAFQYLILMI